MIGIGGTGLSAIARVLLESGYSVTGSDRVESGFTRDLAAAGATIHIGHRAENVHGANLVVRSSAIPDDNPEVVSARKEGIPVLKRADFLGSLMAGKTGIAVAGTHGKTTTTSMLAWVLTSLGQDPSFISGGILANLGVNARAGKGSTFVIEADEYDRMFLGLKPSIEIITNVEHDHPDCYPTPQDFHDAFEAFIKLLPESGNLVICVEDAGAAKLYEKVCQMNMQVKAYGFQPVAPDGKTKADSFIDGFTVVQESGSTFHAHVLGESVVVTLKVPGKHNVLNSLAVLTVIKLLGLDITEAANALKQFRGAGRRFELRGEIAGIIIIDDYAHHPTEIRATLSAARSIYPGKRIWAVWQPHTYSRTRTMFKEFVHAFDDADKVLVTEIYPSREAWQDYSSKEVVNAMTHPSVQFTGSLENTWKTLDSHLQKGDVVLVLSAGDADRISDTILSLLKEKDNG